MTKAKENLKNEVDEIQDERTIEKLFIYVMGIKTQQGIEIKRKEEQQQVT